MNKITAIVLAAGSGSRMKSKTKKQFMEIKGKPVIWYSLFEFEKSRVDEIILVTGKEDIDYCKKEIVEKYKLTNVDFLKVGHHGSDTSSGKEFIDEINPKYSIISVGKNNRYGHPKDKVLNNLSNSKIYRTDLNGAIAIKINCNYKIKTYSP